MPIDEKNGVISSLYTADGKVKLPRTVDKAVTITTGEHRGKTLDQVLAELTEATVNQGIAMANEISAMQDFAAYSGEETQTCDPEMCRQMVEEIVDQRMQEVYDYINLMLQKDIEILSFDCMPGPNFNKGEVVEKIHLVWELNVEPVSVHISDIGEVDADMTGCVIYKKPITETTTFVLSVKDKKGNIKNSELRITFGENEEENPGENPIIPSKMHCYYGTFTEKLSREDIISGTRISMGESTTINLSYNDKRIFFAYPAEYGILTDIRDDNGYKLMRVFAMEEIMINNIRYLVYSNGERSIVKDKDYTFIL